MSSAVREIGQKVWESQKGVIVSMSLGNSYFSEERIKNLLLLLHNNDIVPHLTTLDFDSTSLHNFNAFLDQNKATKKCRLANNALWNKVSRVEEELSSALGVDYSKAFKIEPSTVENNTSYSDMKDFIFDLFTRNREFKSDVLSTSELPLENLSRSYNGSQTLNLLEGSKYLLKELAFFAATPNILNTSSTAFLYNQPFPIFEKLFNNEYLSTRHFDNVGFIEKQVTV